MSTKNKPEQWDIRDVQKSGKGLTMQAVTLSNRYISNGILKNQFIREVDRFEQCLVNDFESGKTSKDAVLNALKKEQRNLIEQGKLIGQKGIGFVAGVMQVMAGAGMCYASAATLCFIGAPMAAHGSNNIYENGKFFIDGDKNATGLVREGYQYVAKTLGYSKSHGDIAYYGADLAMSAYGVVAKTTSVKNASNAYQIASKPNLKVMPWTKTRKAKQFKLFRYSSEDFLRGYQAASKGALSIEALSDTNTLYSINEEVRHID